jgi:hypothetical protein
LYNFDEFYGICWTFLFYSFMSFMHLNTICCIVNFVWDQGKKIGWTGAIKSSLLVVNIIPKIPHKVLQVTIINKFSSSRHNKWKAWNEWLPMGIVTFNQSKATGKCSQKVNTWWTWTSQIRSNIDLQNTNIQNFKWLAYYDQKIKSK